MGSHRDSELLWTALRYVCGELNADETTAFEQRLDEDQSAREAVAEAVELAGAVARLSSDSAVVLGGPRRSRWHALPRWTALAAASLVLAVAINALWSSAHDRGPGRGHVAPSALALAWSGVHEGEDQTGNLLDWLDTIPASGDSHVVAALDASDAAEGGVPDWMLAAASLDGDTAGEPADRKEN